uniref:DIS3-like exonuclease 1 n=1 Tax=Spongospora subterranea TaxID=70186 RepID=A0A0H5QGS8_9EUKA|eukprot:CRZ01223.1 hypothetical protein [Spongospora subterranea]
MSAVVARPYVWHRRNRKGNVIRLSREAYLRSGLVQSVAPRIASLKASHVLLLGPSSLLDLLPILQDLDSWPDPPVVILCRNIVEQIAVLGDNAQYSAVRSLWLKSFRSNRNNLVVAVENVFDVDVWKQRLPGQDQANFSCKSVVSVLNTLQPHLSIPIIIPHDLQEYIKSWQNKSVTLSEALQSTGSPGLSTSTSSIYDEHWSQSRMEAAIYKGDVYRGRIKVKRNRSSAVVTCEKLDILVESCYFNRAIDGDIVAVEVSKATDVSAVAVNDINMNAPLLEEEAEDDDAGIFLDSSLTYRGRVVGIFQRNWRPYVGSVMTDGEDNSRLFFVPIDKRVPRIRIYSRRVDDLLNQRIVGRIDGWSANSRYPDGHIISFLGESGNIHVETKAILLEHGIEQENYVYEHWKTDLPDPEWSITPEMELGRRDLRNSHLICSIDPPGCVDIDDALSARDIGGNNVEIGVHIADVTAFIPFDSRLDLEARRRGTTVYLIDQRINMLPELLSENICSLHEGVDRFAMSVFWTMSPDGLLSTPRFCRTIIRSKYALSYAEAQAISDGKALIGKHAVAVEMRPNLHHLLRLGRLLKAERIRNGALEIQSFESSFRVETVNDGTNVEMAHHEELEFHDIVAELMIAANSAVAKKLSEVYPSGSLMRRHRPPELHRYRELEQMVCAAGGSLDTSSNKSVAESLRNLSLSSTDNWIARIVNSMSAKALTEAQYCVSTADLGHYGLAVEFYTHFTSPIRRYADVIVHRLLLAAIAITDSNPPPQFSDSGFLQNICEHINERNRTSKMAQRDSSDLFFSLYMMSRGESRHEGFIVSINKSKTITVFVPEFHRKLNVRFTDRNNAQCIIGLESLSTKADIIPESSGLHVDILIEGWDLKVRLKLFDRIVIQIAPSGSGASSNIVMPNSYLVWDLQQWRSPVSKSSYQLTMEIFPEKEVRKMQNLGEVPVNKVCKAKIDEMSMYMMMQKTLSVVNVSATSNAVDNKATPTMRCGNRIRWGQTSLGIDDTDMR